MKTKIAAIATPGPAQACTGKGIIKEIIKTKNKIYVFMILI